MITDRELDAQLAGATDIRDADLPALPVGFLGLVKTDAAEVDTTGVTEPASLVAARQLVADAHDARLAGRLRRPGRKTLLRAGVAVVAVAAAWTTAVLVTPSDQPGTRDDTATPSDVTTSPGPTETPTNGIRLVAAEEVTFPLSLDPAPEGLTPTVSRVGGVGYYGDLPLVYTADYSSAGQDRVLVNLFAEDPRGAAGEGWGLDEAPDGSATVDGTAAEVRGGDGYVALLWQRPDGRWVRILGEGAYGEIAALVPVAESLVDSPQPLGLQFGLAPAGWSLTGYEESRSIDLTRDDDPEQLLRLSVYPPGGDASLDAMVGGPDVAGPATPVTIQGREGRLVLVDGYESPDFWRAAGQLADGSLFLLLAPQVLTQEQVVQIADQISYTP